MTITKDIMQDIPDAKPVRAFLPLKNAGERYRVQGIYQKSAPPFFSLLCKPGLLPVDNIDTARPCIINIDMGGPSISLEATISRVVNGQQLVLSAVKSMSHEQMREFFRVDAVAGVIGRSFQPKARANDGQWMARGETIDISGSGILATFAEKPPLNQLTQLEITLPNEGMEVVSALARPIRTVKTSENQYDVAYHFEDITTEDRDKIIGCCLEIQRKLLRLKVQVKDL